MVKDRCGRSRETAVVSSREALRAARAGLPGPVAVVMTMGALHEGHAALLAAARSNARSIVTTVFVNPLQFGPAEDFTRYPRTLEGDLEVCRAEGVDLVFVPSAEEMYPNGEQVVRVDPGKIGEILEGKSRQGHFAGVLTIVLKLLIAVRPDIAYFGEKDYQQLVAIRAMVADFDLPVEIIGVPTVREPDGLARSSRNRYLSGPERAAALTLSQALAAGVAAAGQGSAAVVRAATAVLMADPAVDLDYLVLTDDQLRPVGPEGRGRARLLVAARVGKTRLIDNMAVELD